MPPLNHSRILGMCEYCKSDGLVVVIKILPVVTAGVEVLFSQWHSFFSGEVEIVVTLNSGDMRMNWMVFS